MRERTPPPELPSPAARTLVRNNNNNNNMHEMNIDTPHNKRNSFRSNMNRNKHINNNNNISSSSNIEQQRKLIDNLEEEKKKISTLDNNNNNNKHLNSCRTARNESNLAMLERNYSANFEEILTNTHAMYNNNKCGCDCSIHNGKQYINQIINLNIDYMYECIYEANDFNARFCQHAKMSSV